MNDYLEVLKKYATFSGRARRREYWMYFLFNLIAIIVLASSTAVLGRIGFMLYVLYALGTIIPGLAVVVRRLQDQGKPWTWIFIGLVPFIGGIWFLVLMCTEGTSGENKYGSDPKASLNSADVLDA